MKKVLVVEKDAVAARRMNSLWEAAGYESRVVTDPCRAAVEAMQWRPDLITLDLNESQTEGREVLLQLRSRPQTCRTPVVLLSQKEKHRIPEALRLSVNVIVDKSLRIDRLFQTPLPVTSVAR